MIIIAGQLAAPCSNRYRMAIAIYLKLEKVPFASLGKMARSHEHLIIFSAPFTPGRPNPNQKAALGGVLGRFTDGAAVKVVFDLHIGPILPHHPAACMWPQTSCAC